MVPTRAGNSSRHRGRTPSDQKAMKKLEYNCSRKKAVIDAVEQAEGPFTAQQLWRLSRKFRAGISRSTVYRMLRKLRAEGFIKDIILPHGLHVSIRTDAEAYCIAECEDCGRFRMCPELASTVAANAQEIPILPFQTAIYLRGRCREKLVSGRCQRERK
jgi:Fe2+ or Zn2+ uptake regulation protein